jgi:hypothetical protein
MSDVKTYYYRDYRIDLHPYAGGYRSYVFPPGGVGSGLESAPLVAGAAGREPVLREQVLRDAKLFIDRLVGRKLR